MSLFAAELQAARERARIEHEGASLHDLYDYCVSHGYPEEAEHIGHYLQLQGYVSSVGRTG